MKDFTSRNSFSSPVITLLLLFLHQKGGMMHKGTCPEKYMECCWLVLLVVCIMIPQIQGDTNSRKTEAQKVN